MKKHKIKVSIITGFFILIFVVLVLIYQGISLSKFSNKYNSSSHNISSVIPLSLNPIKITIPTLNIETVIEHVSKNKKGQMDTPKVLNDVAWYILSATPGQLGSAVIAGHFDDDKGNPAIFYTLNTLKRGDKIIITFDNKSTAVFIVEDMFDEKNTKEFASKVFEQSKTESYIHLVTCSGDWNSQLKEYTNRFVVVAKKIN